jgi:hypothetical protein
MLSLDWMAKFGSKTGVLGAFSGFVTDIPTTTPLDNAFAVCFITDCVQNRSAGKLT